MGPKYEFTGETKKHYDYTLHRIRRLSDDRIGGWIESEENLSQEGGCWVDSDAKVYNEAKVYGNAQVYDNAEVFDHAKAYADAKVYGNACVYNWSQVYGNAKVYGHSNASFCDICDNAQVYDKAYVFGHIYGNAQVYGNAKVYDKANVSGNAKVYGEAHVCGEAKIYGNAKVYNKVKVHGDALVHDIEIPSGDYTSGEYFDKNYINEEPLTNPITEVVQDFIYKVDDSNKLATQTEYDSVDEFFSEPIANDIKLDTLVICTVDTKEPLIKLQKVKTEDKTEFKFIVDIINEDNDNFMFKSIIKSQEQLDQLVQQTIEALKQYPKFSKYAEDLDNYL